MTFQMSNNSIRSVSSVTMIWLSIVWDWTGFDFGKAAPFYHHRVWAWPSHKVARSESSSERRSWFKRQDNDASSVWQSPCEWSLLTAHIAYTYITPSRLYFCTIPAVFLASVIGLLQIEKASSRNPERFKHDLEGEFAVIVICLLDEVGSNTALRERKDGNYSWSPVETQECRKQNLYIPYTSVMEISLRHPILENRYCVPSHFLLTHRCYILGCSVDGC